LSHLIFLLHLLFSSAPHILPLSLHDALPISQRTTLVSFYIQARCSCYQGRCRPRSTQNMILQLISVVDAPRYQFILQMIVSDKRDRKSTRLNSSHVSISYAVFCLKKNTSCCI